MSYERLTKREAELAAEITELEAQADGLLAEAAQVDAAEDARYGADRRGDELPAELARRTQRLATIREAKADLEAETAEAAARARAKAQKKAAREAAKADRGADPAATSEHSGNGEPSTAGDGSGSDRTEPGEPEPAATVTDPTVDEAEVEAAAQAAAAAAVPKPTAQRNFTDPDSRIMKTSDRSFHQCYNGQAVVDEAHQIIVAMKLTNQAADAPPLPDLLDEVEANLAALPRWLLADAGYFSEHSCVRRPGRERIDRHRTVQAQRAAAACAARPDPRRRHRQTAHGPPSCEPTAARPPTPGAR